MLVPKIQIRLLSSPLISADAQSSSARMQPRATKPERAAQCQNHVDFSAYLYSTCPKGPEPLRFFEKFLKITDDGVTGFINEALYGNPCGPSCAQEKFEQERQH